MIGEETKVGFVAGLELELELEDEEEEDDEEVEVEVDAVAAIGSVMGAG